MRIRKHWRSSLHIHNGISSLSPGGIVLQTYICEMNQSPWEVLTFPIPENPAELLPPQPSLSPPIPENPAELLPPQPSLSPLPYPIEIDHEESPMENVSIQDFFKTKNSELSMNNLDEDKLLENIDENGKLEIAGNGENEILGSSHGEKKVEKQHSNYHKKRSSMSKQYYKLTEKPKKNSDTRGRLRSKKCVTSSSHSEYVYYSGFGPYWRKRGDNGSSSGIKGEG